MNNIFNLHKIIHLPQMAEAPQGTDISFSKTS